MWLLDQRARLVARTSDYFPRVVCRAATAVLPTTCPDIWLFTPSQAGLHPKSSPVSPRHSFMSPIPKPQYEHVTVSQFEFLLKADKALVDSFREFLVWRVCTCSAGQANWKHARGRKRTRRRGGEEEVDGGRGLCSLHSFFRGRLLKVY